MSTFSACTLATPEPSVLTRAFIAPVVLTVSCTPPPSLTIVANGTSLTSPLLESPAALPITVPSAMLIIFL